MMMDKTLANIGRVIKNLLILILAQAQVFRLINFFRLINQTYLTDLLPRLTFLIQVQHFLLHQVPEPAVRLPDAVPR
jgi:hypothetical protein